VTLQPGAPFTVNLGTDRANIGSRPAQRPDVSGDANGGGAQTAQQWFNTNVFSLPAPFSFGNSGRNTSSRRATLMSTPQSRRTIRLPHATRLELRWEAFNLFNHVNFDVPNRIAFTPNFGRIFSAGPARQMQLGIKLMF
jgi:hypothetical protein